MAALGVIYEPRTGRQSYHEGHLGDIISLTVSSCGRFAASGDAANPPRVHVWDAVTGAGETRQRHEYRRCRWLTFQLFLTTVVFSQNVPLAANEGAWKGSHRHRTCFASYVLLFPTTMGAAGNVQCPYAIVGVVCGGGGGKNSGLLPSLHRVGVALLAFSCDGHWLASMGHDPEHTLAVYT